MISGYQLWLPAHVLRIAELHEQLSRGLLEDGLVALGEGILPVARHPLPARRGAVLLPPLAPAAALLEALGSHALPQDLLVGLYPQEVKNPLELLLWTLQQVLVAHLGVVVPKQPRTVAVGRADVGSPHPRRGSDAVLGEDALA